MTPTDPPACPMPDPTQDDRLRSILSQASTVAVVGMSGRPDRPSREVGLYLRDHGYQVLPVHPREKEIDGLVVYPDLPSLPADVQVDIVDLFINPSHQDAVIEQAIELDASVIWFQPGAENPAGEERAREAGIEVVSGHCIMAEHRRRFR